MQIKDSTKKRAGAAAVVAAAAWLVALTVHSCGSGKAQGFQSGGGVVLSGGGGGISKVTTTGTQFTGSGTPSNPLALALSVSSPVSGTGSSGSPITSSGDISAVTAGSGLSGGATSGAATLAVNAGSGITADGTSTRVATGSGLTFSSGALITNAGSGMTYNSGALQPSLGTGLTFSGGNVVASLTGGTCSNGQGVTSLSSTGTATCGNVGKNNVDGTHYEWNDDFLLGGACTSGAACGAWLGCTTSGTGAACGGQNNGTTTRPGIFDLVSGTTTNKLALLNTGIASVDYGSGSWSLDCTVGFPTLSDGSNTYAAIIGFGDITTGVNQTDGCYFLYDQGNVATNGGNSGNANKFECVCGNNTGSPTRTVYLMDGSTTSDESFTTVNAPVAALTLPSTNIYRLKVQMTGTTRAEFYVNGTKSCDINTHIPSGSSRLTGTMLMIVSSAGVAEKMSMDQCTLSYDMTAARSP